LYQAMRFYPIATLKEWLDLFAPRQAPGLTHPGEGEVPENWGVFTPPNFPDHSYFLGGLE